MSVCVYNVYPWVHKYMGIYVSLFIYGVCYVHVCVYMCVHMCVCACVYTRIFQSVGTEPKQSTVIRTQCGLVHKAEKLTA